MTAVVAEGFPLPAQTCASWFLECCADDGSMDTPKALTIAGEPWVMASDGKHAVAIPGAGGSPHWVGAPGAALLFAPQAYTHRIDAAELLAFVGVPRDPVVCKECDGGGRAMHQCDCQHCELQTDDCGYCDGGLADAPAERFTILGECFDKTRVAAMAVDLEGPLTVALVPHVGPSTGLRGFVLAVDAPGRRMRLMSMLAPTDKDKAELAVAPALPLVAL